MKILRGIIGTLIMPIMIILGIIGVGLVILSIELQPENLVNLTTDIIADTLSKDNLKKIQVSDIVEYLPTEIKVDLPAEATMEEVVPIVFNNLTGVESYISLEAVERMIEDDVVKDFTLAVLNEERYDLVGLVDKYGVSLEARERELLAEVDTSIFKAELAKQGFDIDKITSEGLGVIQGSGVAGQNQGGQNPLNPFLVFLQPGVAVAILIGVLAGFYLLFGLIWWSLKTGLIWWGVGVGLIGVILLVLNGIKLEFVEFGLGFTSTNINVALITPAVERIARPLIISGIICLIGGVVTVVGGEFWRKR